MGSPFGIPIYVSPTWFIVAILITLWFEPVVQARLHTSNLGGYLIAFVFAVLLYVSVLLHELAHCVVARMFGLPVRRITLYLLGGVSEIEKEPQTPGREFWVAFAGPLLSLGLAGAGFVFDRFLADDSVVGVLVLQLWFANLVVGVFNLLPGLPLDGGRLLRAGVWKITRNPGSGTVAAAWVGRGLALLLALTPFLLGLLTGAFDFVMVIWAAILSAFIWFGATQALQSARVQARLPHVQARALARRAIPVTADLPLAEAMRRAHEARAGALVVVDPAGTPLALVNEAAVTATPEHRRPWVTAGSVARTLEPGLTLPADLSGEALIEAVRRNPAGEYLLVEPGGGVYGVLSTSDLEHVFARS
ncbi:site-2 protease family protein [Bailinhaonella thermotolerans]|uniref:Zinc metalloprotease n=2 Tax=Bailinhaonella thermotolerans TaxID=1070861 RepID=A0A3A4BAQ4_9ACTN|nr:site-2 protease family protein [Bailinhaonella thermotolerans]